MSGDMTRPAPLDSRGLMLLSRGLGFLASFPSRILDSFAGVPLRKGCDCWPLSGVPYAEETRDKVRRVAKEKKIGGSGCERRDKRFM